MIIGPHNHAAHCALKSKAQVVTVYGPAGVGKTFVVAAHRREGDALIDLQPGDTLTEIPDAKRVVITAHKHPRNMELPDRVLARLASGVIVKHESWPRDELARLLDDSELPEAAREAVLDQVTTPREIMGALTTWEHTDGDDWRARLRAFIGTHVSMVPSRTLLVPEIINAVCNQYGLTHKELASARRTRNLVHPRQVAMYLIRCGTTLTLAEIGAYFGDRDHATVLHSVNAVKQRILDDPALRAEIQLLGKRAKEAA